VKFLRRIRGYGLGFMNFLKFAQFTTSKAAVTGENSMSIPVIPGP
jgi:hypothetical protein